MGGVGGGGCGVSNVVSCATTVAVCLLHSSTLTMLFVEVCIDFTLLLLVRILGDRTA